MADMCGRNSAACRVFNSVEVQSSRHPKIAHVVKMRSLLFRRNESKGNMLTNLSLSMHLHWASKDISLYILLVLFLVTHAHMFVTKFLFSYWLFLIFPSLRMKLALFPTLSLSQTSGRAERVHARSANSRVTKLLFKCMNSSLGERQKSSPHLLFNSPCNEKNLHLEMVAFCISRVKSG